MTEYDEELLRQRVWSWLEHDKQMSVDAEIEIGTGRIDLVAKSEDEVCGIEVKTGHYQTEQLHRYAESNKLDRLYIASGVKLDTNDASSFDVSELAQVRRQMAGAIEAGMYTEEEAKSAISEAIPDDILTEKIGSQTLIDYVTLFLSTRGRIRLEEAVERISRAISFPEVGVIYVPDVDPYNLLGSEEVEKPKIIQNAKLLGKKDEPNLQRREEPFVRHSIWQNLGGIPEGHIPNTLDSDQPYRPIDLITFEGSRDPTDVIECPEENKIIGVEAKGEGSFSPNSIRKQLTEFLETETLSQLYLAIPGSLADRAVELIKTDSDLDPVGIIEVSTGGETEVVRESTEVIPEYDGYIENHEMRKTGYGENYPSKMREVSSPFVTDEEAERLKHSDSIEYARNILSGDPWSITDPVLDAPKDSRDSLSEITDNLSETGSRIYILDGSVASHSTMEKGYVELLVEYYREEDCLSFNFGRNYGGYIWFKQDEIDLLMTKVSSLPDLGSEKSPGKGFVQTSLYSEYASLQMGLEAPESDIDWIEDNVLPDMDINEDSVTEIDFPASVKPRPSYATHHEEPLSLEIISQVDELDGVDRDQKVCLFRLGNKVEGADVEFTYAQWCDLIAAIHILREKSGTNRELPGKQTSSWTRSRIAPSGQLIQDTNDIDYQDDVLR